MGRGDPIEGQVLLLASAKASVGNRLPDIVDEAQAHLGARLDELGRRYETVYECDEYVVLLAERGFWDGVAHTLDLTDRERTALRRAHEEQFRRVGRREERLEEFETALDIRTPVVVGR